jgi:hypothetical protein
MRPTQEPFMQIQNATVLITGADEVLADALTQQVKASLSSATPAYLAVV